ncbi:MAG: hypothetical protein MI919_00685, partial [Holophagales bacterium]|nr:hypothetical protein [Holophagales bacterium]
GFGISMILGRHVGRNDVVAESVDEVELLGPLPHGLQVDGDVLPIEPPVRIRVERNALRVLMPARR